MDNGLGYWSYKHADLNADREAFVQGESRVTYAQFNVRTNKLARALEDIGVSKGDRVALLSTNSIEFMEVLFAVAKIGAICVPLNFRLAGPELAYAIANSESRALFYSGDLHDSAQAALNAPEVVDVRHVVCIPADGADDAVDVASGVTMLRYQALLEAGQSHDVHRSVDTDDPLLILYTSGTTGRPKGAMLTHHNMYTNAIHLILAGQGLSRYDKTITPCPLFHVGGLCVHTVPLFYAGGCTVVMREFDPAGLLKLMEQEKATVEFLVPAMWSAVVRVPDFDSYDLSALRYTQSGGAPCPITVIEFLQSKGWDFLEGFGMTETCAGAMVLDADNATRKLGAVGKPVMHDDARIVDETGTDAPQGTVGELVMRGPNIFIGYWKMPEATADAIRDGWFHTGDLARIDEEGFFWIVDRKKDMIITGGENVYPIETEQVLHHHPAIADVAVIGVPDDKWGEAVVAIVVPELGATLVASEIIAYTRERIAGYKAPKRIEIIEELPRNATGKILKRELRRIYTGREGSVSR